MKYVFGPVPSRRLGQSLGIDPIPLKTCNWNCVYCQLGRTAPLVLERGEYVPREDLLAEVEQALAAARPGEIDWVTFVGSGEPTLHAGLGWMISRVKASTSLPVAVITNGSLLHLPQVRAELAPADAILPTLDAGNERLYRQINRAAPRFTFERLVEGMFKFRRMSPAKLWIEIMLIQNLNDTPEALAELGQLLEWIEPHQVHITLPVRPPAEAWVRPSDPGGLQRAREILGRVIPVSIPAESEVKAIRQGELEEILLSVITRHPMKVADLRILLDRWSAPEVESVLENLKNSKKIRSIEQGNEVFWRAVKAPGAKKR